jgi:hypothetical protein
VGGGEEERRGRAGVDAVTAPGAEAPHRGGRRWALAGAVLLAQAALVAAIYPSPARFGFVGDAWGYILTLRSGVFSMLWRPQGYHWQPVAYAYVEILRLLFGDRPAAFQAVNLAQLVSIGYLAYILGRRATGDAGIGFLASLLLLGSATYYEVAYWPLAGNMHLLSVQLYLAALLLAWDVGAGRRAGAGPWLVGASALGAVLAHPAMVTVVPVAMLTLVLAARERGLAWRDGDRRRTLLLLAGVAVAGIGARLYAQATVGDMPPMTLGRMALWNMAIMTANMLTLRGSVDWGYGLVSLGLGVGSPALRLWTGVALWTAGPLAVLAYGLRAARGAGFRVLAVVFVVHGYALAVNGGIAPRQAILLQVPVTILSAWALHRLAERASTWMGGEMAGAVLRQMPMVAALLLVVAALRDHRTAARLTLQAGATSTALFHGIEEAVPRSGPAPMVVLVNPPTVLLERGMGSMVFRNGALQIMALASRPDARMDFRDMPLPDVLPYRAEAPAITPTELRAMVKDPLYVVFVCHQPPRLIRHVTAENVEEVIAGR